MGLNQLFRRMALRRSHSMIDTLESRALLSASPVTVSAAAAGSDSVTHYSLFALKGTVTSLKQYSTTSTPGAAVTLAASVAGTRSTGVPTGTVTFLAGTTTLGTATLNSEGTAKLVTTALPTGTSAITAVYSGSIKFSVSTSTGITHTVALPASTTKLSVTSSTSTTLGIATTLLAKVGSAAGGTVPTGRVAFYDGSTLLASKALNSVGAARLTANYLFVGSHDLKAIYLGSASYLGHRSTTKTVTVSLPAMTTTSDGLQVGVVTQGTGLGAATGDTLTVDYTGYLSDGTKFQSSLDSGTPFSFPLGEGKVIAGFDEGLQNVEVGEKRVLIIPGNLAYGNNPPSGIPANATLVFVVNVLSVTPGS